MKKLLKLFLVLGLAFSTAACGGKEDEKPNTGAEFKVAMVTDYGDITDQSFNQTTYEAAKAWCEANNVEFTYKKPATNADADRVASMEEAIEDGYNVLVLPGYAFAPAIVEIAALNPETKFVALDVSEYDLFSANGNKDFSEPNVFCAVYQEELSGYMAGYAAVKLGYKKHGFVGGMAVPAVIRFGFGYVQGVDAAAKELGIENEVEIVYAYGNQFYGDADITARMDTWYANGTEVVFACGGAIYTSAAEAAQRVNGKLVGVDVDQKAIIDGTYGEGMTVTSAMKGLAPTVDLLLTAIKDGKWADYSGKVQTLGLVGEDPYANYVQIPSTTQFGDGFTEDDYKALVKAMLDGTVTVDAQTEKMPTTAIKVTDEGNIK